MFAAYGFVWTVGSLSSWKGRDCMAEKKRGACGWLAVLLAISLAFSPLQLDVAFAADTDAVEVELSQSEQSTIGEDAAEDLADGDLADQIDANQQADNDIDANEESSSDDEASLATAISETQSLATTNDIVAQSADDGVQSVSDDALQTKECSRTFEGVGGQFNVGISFTTDDAELVAAFEAAELTALPQSKGDELYDAAALALADRYEGDLTFDVWDLTLESGGSELVLPEGAEVEVEYTRYLDSLAPGVPGFAGLGSSPKYFALEGDSLSELAVTDSVALVEGMLYYDSLSVSGIVDIVGLNGDGLVEKEPAEKYQAGTYSVSGNLYVVAEDAPIGQNAYMTTAAFPPIAPGVDNATLVVGEDGSLTLTLYPVNEIFTLQSIEGGADTHVVSTARGGAASSYGNHSDRITKVVLTLDNDNGTYQLGNCVQCPTVFLGGADQKWRMCVDVDFDSMKEGGASEPGESASSLSFTDLDSGVSVGVSTSNADTLAKLQDAKLSVVTHESDAIRGEVNAALLEQQLFMETPTYELWTIGLVDEAGKTIEIVDSTVLVSIPTSFSYIDSYKYTSGDLAAVSCFNQQGSAIIQDVSLGTYAIADSYSAYKWISWEFENPDIGLEGVMRASSQQAGIDGYKADGALEFNTAKTVVEQGAAYSFSLMLYGEDPLPFWWEYESYLSLSVPVENDSAAVYLVRDDGTSVSALNLGAEVSDGRATFNLVNLERWGMTRDQVAELLIHLHNGYANGIDSSSAENPVAYILVTSESLKVVDTPYALQDSGFTYSAEEIIGVHVDENCKVVSGTITETNAGSYSVTVEPAEGYTWFDGTGDPVTVEWKIRQATLKAEFNDYYLPYNADVTELNYEATLVGLLGDDTESSIGYKTVSVKKDYRPESLEPGSKWQSGSYANYLENYGQVFLNYVLSYDNLTISMGMSPEDEPQVVEGLVYNGQSQIGVVRSESTEYKYELSNVEQTEAGTYTAIAKRHYQDAPWSDGSKEDKVIEFTIAPATLTAAYVGGETDEGVAPSTADSIVVTGFVNGETAETADGYVAPTVEFPNLLQAGSYELSPSGGQASNYVFVYVPGTLVVKKNTVDFEPGTYTITANLMMPREYNPILSGVDVYANSPNNPFSDYAGNAPVLDGNVSAEEKIPSDPETTNATLIVGADGTKTLLLPVKNPVFTTQSLGTCSALGEVKVERVAPADPSKWTYGSCATRIDKVLAQLTDNLSSGTAAYVFTGSELYAVPLDLTIKPDGDTALQLEVDYSSAQRVSSSTTVPELNPDPAEDPSDDGNEPGGPDKPTDPSGGNNGNGNNGTTDGNNGTMTPDGNGNGNNGSNGNNTNGGGTTDGSADTQAVAHLKEGTYTVTSNIWVSRESSGLPLSPHLTSSIFPPKDPASSNATLRVDASGRALLTIPIVIQDKVMTVQSIAISGYSIVASTSSGGSLTSITVDLGVLENPAAVITRSATVNITMGSLASVISGISGAQTWAATFEVNLTGVPVTSGTTLSGTSTASGQGTIPESALAILSGDGESVDAEANAAAEAALAAAEGKASAPSNRASGGSESGSQDEEAAGVPAAAIALGVVCVLAVAGAAIYVVARRRKKQQDAA